MHNRFEAKQGHLLDVLIAKTIVAAGVVDQIGDALLGLEQLGLTSDACEIK